MNDSPLARTTDPLTSHLSANEMKPEFRGRMQDVAAEAVADHPGFTSNELERACGYSDGQLRKRLKELVRLGRIQEGKPRKSTITGRLCITYWPVAKSQAA